MFEKERSVMVEHQLVRRRISNEAVIYTMTNTPRHEFLPDTKNPLGYGDFAVPIGQGQTISQPYIVARMLELLEPQPMDKVLEIGSGSGYVTALLSRICNKVIGIERIPELVKKAKENLKRLKITNAIILEGDGSIGAVHHYPYNKIVVSAAMPEIPKELKDQLKSNGIIVAPIGDRMKQKIVKIQKLPNGELKETTYDECAFVPIIGKNGFES